MHAQTNAEQPMQKITPHLWFDDQAEEAAHFYTSVFDNSSVNTITRYPDAGRETHGKDAGTVMTVEFELDGHAFTALNGGPHFSFTPAVSFFVSCETEREVNEMWETLADPESILMPLQKYPFSQRYGWAQDKYGLSWQVMLTDDRPPNQKITPSLMFVGEQAGKAEEALHFYTSVFDRAEIGDISRYGKDEEPDEEGTIKHAAFTLEGQSFAAMDSNRDHAFTFNEAISFTVDCQSQQEVDSFWEKLSEGGDEEAQECGWLKDKFGVSWQVVPTVLSEMLRDADETRSQRVMQTMLQMKKLDIDDLKAAYEGGREVQS